MVASIQILAGFSGFKPSWIPLDLTAGFAIAAVALPSAIAYPAIAGLPPEVGLYSSILPLIGYALLGPSRQLIVGPDAATMTVLAAALASLPVATAADRVVAASMLALLVGAMCLGARLLRLGVIASFLSRPILIGFISGISISILVGQIPRFTGLQIEADGLVPPLIELLRKAAAINWPSVALGCAMFALLMLLGALRSPVPGPVVVVVVAIAASWVLDFEAMGIKLVGNLPETFPTLSLAFNASLPVKELLLGAAAVWLVSFGSGLVAARSFGARGKFRVDADAELVGFGAANISSGLFGGFPVAVSDSRTAINLSVGGRSQLAGVVAALVLSAMLLYLHDAVRILPVPALGAILAAAAVSLIDIASLRALWRISKVEFAFAMIGMWGAVSLGVLSGVVIAIAATLLYVLLKEMRPRIALLGRIPGRKGFYKLHRSAGAHSVPGITVCLIQGSLLFFNVDYVRERLEGIAGRRPSGTRWFVIDASAIAQLDSTAAGMLEELRATFATNGLTLAIAELHKEPMEILDRAGVIGQIGPGMVFDDLEDMARAFEKRVGQPQSTAP